jgi:hypothetical protein
MFLRLAALGADQVALLIDENTYTGTTSVNGGTLIVNPDEIRNYLATPAALAQAFNDLDSDHDGLADLGEALSGKTVVGTFDLGPLQSALKAEMAIGSANENVLGLGVSMVQLPPRL